MMEKEEKQIKRKPKKEETIQTQPKNSKNKIENILVSKWFHILIIVLGSIFILLGAFHTEVWFDESYTIALVSHNISDIIRIDSNDVHPVLYYLLLKAATCIFGNSILVARLFSVFAGIIVGILGFTHIRKDFGPKVGLAFSFLMYFLPFMCMYGMEIRMYSWTMLFTTLSGIYAYRSIKYDKKRNWFLFAMFSLCAAHCHYYGLVAVAIVNALLLFHILFSKKLYEEKIPYYTSYENFLEQKKKLKKKYIIRFLVSAIIEIIGYLPWLFIFLTQAGKVSESYWIPFNWQDSIAAPLGVQFNGRLSVTISAIFALIMYIYLIYKVICLKKQKQNLIIIWYCLLVHFILFFSMLLVTIFIRPIMYYRYMLITSGIFLFPFAYVLLNNPTKMQKIISSIVVIIILGLSIYNNSIIINENYDKTNGEEISYIKEQYQEGDIILYGDYFHASNIFVQMPE